MSKATPEIPGLYPAFVKMLTEAPLKSGLLSAAIEGSDWERARLFHFETRRSAQSNNQPCHADNAMDLIRCGPSTRAFWLDSRHGESLWYLVAEDSPKGPFHVASFGSAPMRKLRALARARREERTLAKALASPKRRRLGASDEVDLAKPKAKRL